MIPHDDFSHRPVTAPAQSPVSLLREFSIPLLAGVGLALLWANSNPAGYQHGIAAPMGLAPSLHFWVNDLFMVFFFGIAAVEITDSCAPGGSLNPLKKAINPLLATVGGVLGPVGAYFLLNHFWGEPRLHSGWGITTATDIAIAWLVARIVFGKGHPAVSFLLLLAVADDAIGLGIIALFYPDPRHPVVLAPLLLVLCGAGIAWGLRRCGVTTYWFYLLLGGGACWAGMFLAHLHPALALVFVVPFMPHRPHPAAESAFDLHPAGSSTLATFEQHWKIVVDFGLFFFGLANAGVAFSFIGTGTWLVLVSLVVGKTIGIGVFALLGKVLGFPLPARVGIKELLLVGLIAGIGLTVALFVAGAAFTDPALQGAAKMGALLSAAAAVPAIILGQLLRVAAPTTLAAEP